MKPSLRLSLHRTAAISLVAVAAMTPSGCRGGQSKWEITVENKGTSPCSVYVTMDSANANRQANSDAEVEDLAAGAKLTLIAGESVQTIRSVKVVRGDDEQELTRNAELHPGNRYAIVVTADGKVEAALDERK